jgi:tetratricopeptide (TPR) repeat protein
MTASGGAYPIRKKNDAGPMADGAHPEKPISLFYSYSHRDEAFRGELEAHLSFLRRSQQIAEWHDRMIGAGADWKGQIDRQLATADIVLLLVSADFIASDYCWGEEMAKALVRHQLGEARVIPVILRPCRWQRTPLKSLQAVPKDGKPVSEWPNHDAAFDEIATAIERTIADLQQQRRHAAEQRQQEAVAARQAVEEQQREAQRRREQDEARRAAEAEAARVRGIPDESEEKRATAEPRERVMDRAKPTKGPRTSPSIPIFHQKRWMALFGAVAVVAATGVVVWQELGKESPPTPSPAPVARDTTKPSVAPPSTEPPVKAIAGPGSLDSAWSNVVRVEPPPTATPSETVAAQPTRPSEREIKAVADARQNVSENPKNPDFQHELGNALLAAGEVDEAINAYRRAISLPPKRYGMAYHYRDLAEALEEAGRTDEAIVALRTAFTKWPLRDDKYEVRCAGPEAKRMVSLLKKKGDFSAALAFYKSLYEVHKTELHGASPAAITICDDIYNELIRLNK